jgi:hypothetical protein
MYSIYSIALAAEVLSALQSLALYILYALTRLSLGVGSLALLIILISAILLASYNFF